MKWLWRGVGLLLGLAVVLATAGAAYMRLALPRTEGEGSLANNLYIDRVTAMLATHAGWITD